MRGGLAVLVIGTGLGLTSAWHASAGGVGTSGRVGPIVLLVVIAALTGAAWAFRGW